MEIQSSTHDALVLLAINSGQGILINNGVTIEEIIEYIDAFDRTILTHKEFSEAIKRLLAIGFVKIENEKIYTTKYFHQQKKMHCKKVSGFINQLGELKKLLEINKNNFVESEDSFNDFLSLESYELALATYRIR